jgi:multisubunit Na+/H+ antiporter MnhB subunit
MPYRHKRKKIKKKDIKLFLVILGIAVVVGAFISFLDGGISLIFQSVEDFYIQEAVSEATGKPATNADVVTVHRIFDPKDGG